MASECSRIRHAESGLELNDTYRCRVIQNALREHEICTAYRLLRGSGIEPILLKGWSVGRHYPDPGTRALGDIDLVIQDAEAPLAEKVLQDQGLNVDWHKLSGLRAEFTRPEDLVARSELVPLLDTPVRVPCHEHSLRFVAIHMLRHGGWSPHWVADVAVLVDSRPPLFDWDVCAGSDPVRRDWVLSALVIARELLGADISATPAENYRIPEWMPTAVRNAWRDTDPSHHQPPESIWTALAHPWRLPHGIRRRWPDPIAAAVMTGAPFNRRRPWFHQLRYCTNLAGNFLRRSSSESAN